MFRKCAGQEGETAQADPELESPSGSLDVSGSREKIYVLRLICFKAVINPHSQGAAAGCIPNLPFTTA